MGNLASATRVAMNAMIVNMNTGATIELVNLPDELTDSQPANFSEVALQGRSAPLLAYENSGPRTINFTVQLHDDYQPGGILSTVHKLKALAYPKYGSRVQAPKCYVRFGNMVKATAVCTDVSVTWKKPIRDGIYICADVSLSFKTIQDLPLGSGDVEIGRE